MKQTNIEHRTSNTEYRSRSRFVPGSMFSVRCWVLGVLSFLALLFPVHAQLILGRTPFDKFVPAFWEQNTNANSALLGFRNATAPLFLPVTVTISNAGGPWSFSSIITSNTVARLFDITNALAGFTPPSADLSVTNQYTLTNSFSQATNYLATNSAAKMAALSNSMVAMAPITFSTIADMIAGFTTNLCYVKAHSGTNGIGGGFFELRHTNGFATNTGTIFASPVPRKFAFRVYSGQINAHWFGVKGDGATDDSLALQAWCNMATNPIASLYLPIGEYRLTSTLSVTGYNAGDGWRMSGEFGRPRGPRGSRIIWYGATGGTMMQLMGVSGSTLEHIILDAVSGGSPAKFCLTVDARNGEASNPSAISSGMKFKGMMFAGPVGADSACVLLSHVSAGSPQVSEMTWEDCYFSGTTGTDYLVRSLWTGNTKNFSFFNCLQTQATNGFYFLSGNGNLRFENIQGGIVRTNITTGPGCSLEVTSWYDEGSGLFLMQNPGGASRSSARISGLEWAGATLNTNDIVMYIGSQCLIQSSHFYNSRTASSVPNILLAEPRISDSPSIRSSIKSEENYYQNATVPPIYGGDTSAGYYTILTNQWLFHRTGGSYSGTNVAALSINDMGGTGGALIPFKSYDKTGGDTAVDYLEVFGSGVWHSNKLSVGTNAGTGVLNVHGRKYWNGGSSNASPVSLIGRLANGEEVETAIPSSVGDFVGPGSATDSALVLFDSTTGKLGKNSVVLITNTTHLVGAQRIGINTNAPQSQLHARSTDNTSSTRIITASSENGAVNVGIGYDSIRAGGAATDASLSLLAKGANGYLWLGNDTENTGLRVGIADTANMLWFGARSPTVTAESGRHFFVGTTSSDTNGLQVDTTTGHITVPGITNSSAPTNTIVRIGPGGLHTAVTIGANLTLSPGGELSASGGSGTPNGPFGAIQWGETSILRGTNSLLWTNDTLILNNPDTTGSRYLYWAFGNLVTPAFSVQATTNLWLLQSDFGSSGPRFIRARKDDRSLAFGGIGSLSSITNDANVYNNSNVVNAGSVENRSAVTNAGAVNNASPVTNWNQVVGMSQFAGQPSTDSYGSTNQNGKLFTLQSALIATNQTLIWPTNGWNGLTPPFFIGISNVVGDVNGTTGQVVFTASADFATVAWVNAVSNRFDAFSVTLTNQGNVNSVAASNLSYAIGTALTNYVDVAASNRVRVAVSGPSFATVTQAGSGGVQTFTLTASTALGNWQGLTSHGYTNDTVNVFAAASVVTSDAAARTHIQTNRMTAAQTLVHTNFTVGQVSTEVIPGAAAGGTAHVLTYAVVAGSLIRTNDSVFIASSGFGISVPAGYALEISAMQKSFLSTNVVDLKIAYQPQ